MTLFIPSDEKEAAEIIRAATAEGAPLKIVGGGSKTSLGRHAPAQRAVSTRALNGVTLYEPEELVLSARAGTPLAEIEALLDANGQRLAFEPFDYAALLGEAGAATDRWRSIATARSLGGIVAVNASGPRRIKAGAARDHLLGFRCVTGRGDIVKSGGRVMKNVTGYDLSKLVAGSFGTLALLTEATLKVLPRAETEQTLLVLGLDEEASLAVLRRASGAPCEVSSFAMLPAGATPLRLTQNAAALRLEGPQISVTARRDDLASRLATAASRFETLPDAQSRAFWRDMRCAAPIADGAGQVWRASVAPTDGYALVEGVRRRGVPLLAHCYDWAGGLVWLRLAEAADAYAGALRAIVDRLGGHATLIRADADVRSRVDVFHPQPAALAALSRRVKESFDPAHILERGRMRAEF
jgi:glycolate oxidase FAD binding subunit